MDETGVPFLDAMLAQIRAGGPDLSQRQLTILMLAAWTVGPHRCNSLARLLGIPAPSVSRAVTSLVGMGLVYHQKTQDDARIYYVRATPKGIAHVERLHEMIYGHERVCQ